MCVLKPRTRAQMLEVSGIGEFKYEKYGERFLQKIRELTAGETVPEDLDPDEEEDQALEKLADSEDLAAPPILRAPNTRSRKEEQEKERKTSGVRKQEFVMTEEIAGQIQYSSKVTLTEFLRQINSLRDETHVKCLAFSEVMSRLVGDGYLTEEPGGEDGKKRRTITAKGIVAGIFSEKVFSQYGDEYDVIYYAEKAQRQLVKKLLGEWKRQPRISG